MSRGYTINEASIARKGAAASLGPALEAIGSRIRGLPPCPETDPLPEIIAGAEAILVQLRAIPLIEAGRVVPLPEVEAEAPPEPVSEPAPSKRKIK